MHFLLNGWTKQLQTLQLNRSYDVEGYWATLGVCLRPKVKVKSEIMYFLVNAFPPKRLDLATSNFADALVSSKAGICDGVPSTEV